MSFHRLDRYWYFPLAYHPSCERCSMRDLAPFALLRLSLAATANIKVVRVLVYAREYLCMHINAVSNRKGRPISRSEGKKKCANAQNVCLVWSRADLRAQCHSLPAGRMTKWLTGHVWHGIRSINEAAWGVIHSFLTLKERWLYPRHIYTVSFISNSFQASSSIVCRCHGRHPCS